MDKKKGYLCIFVTTILFSSMEIVLKLSAGEFNPVQITMERFLVGGLLLIPFAYRRSASGTENLQHLISSGLCC